MEKKRDIENSGFIPQKGNPTQETVVYKIGGTIFEVSTVCGGSEPVSYTHLPVLEYRLFNDFTFAQAVSSCPAWEQSLFSHISVFRFQMFLNIFWICRAPPLAGLANLQAFRPRPVSEMAVLCRYSSNRRISLWDYRAKAFPDTDKDRRSRLFYRQDVYKRQR